MRRKRDRRPAVPLKFRRYVPGEWPGGPGQWTHEREQWNAAQPRVLIAGTGPVGPWSYLAGPLGDETDLARARIEARRLGFADLG